MNGTWTGMHLSLKRCCGIVVSGATGGMRSTNDGSEHSSEAGSEGFSSIGDASEIELDVSNDGSDLARPAAASDSIANEGELEAWSRLQFRLFIKRSVPVTFK